MHSGDQSPRRQETTPPQAYPVGPDLLTVRLAGYRLMSRHGILPGEKEREQPFEVSVDVILPVKDRIHDIGDTVSYTDVLEVVRAVMSDPTDLLETLAATIAERIQAAFPSVLGINISIDKLEPPIPNFVGRVGITYAKRYD